MKTMIEEKEKTASAVDIKRAEDIKVLLDRWIKKKSLENKNRQLEEAQVEKVSKVWKTK